jgi:ABC-type uncharacterized transport system substrate-binding protein
MLREMAPDIRRAALMFNPETAPFYKVLLRQFGAAPAILGTEIVAAPVQNEADIEEAAVAAFAREPNGGLIVAGDAFNAVNRALIMTSVERQRLPAIYYLRQAVAEGGLMSYGPDTADIVRRSASYVDRILKGANPADLPVQQPIKSYGTDFVNLFRQSARQHVVMGRRLHVFRHPNAQHGLICKRPPCTCPHRPLRPLALCFTSTRRPLP